ncbi:MAG: hypothetical protein HUK13_10460 [Muribaculaceae bacterium]|nr:hypothetical protein [Muribaculaceae bacterium]
MAGATNEMTDMDKRIETAMCLYESVCALQAKGEDSTAMEEQAIALISAAIDDGCVEAYPMKALLESSNDWTRLVICRMTQFQIVLREGVDKGCLDPRNDFAWIWLEIAAKNNDPTPFLDDDMEQYYDILMTAVENGRDVRDIIYKIWEPEQEIDDD